MAIVEVSLTQSVQLCPGTQNKKSAPMNMIIGLQLCFCLCLISDLEISFVAELKGS